MTAMRRARALRGGREDAGCESNGAESPIDRTRSTAIEYRTSLCRLRLPPSSHHERERPGEQRADPVIVLSTPTLGMIAVRHGR
jgi:hypothetical protein